MKKMVVGLMVVGLVGCSNRVEEVHIPNLPPELADCKLFEITYSGSYVKVMRCPNSTTSTTWRAGKSATHHAIVVDGVEYVKKE